MLGFSWKLIYHQPLITTDVILYVASDICSSLLAEGTALAEG